MPDTKAMTGRELGQALCKHLGIDIHKHKVDSHFDIKTEPGEPVAVKLTFMLSADDLAGIARAAGVGIDDKASDTLKKYGIGAKDTQTMAIKVDASEAAALVKEAGDDLAAVIRAELRNGVETMLDLGGRMLAEQRTTVAELVPGEELAIDPDPRLDEIVSLLKRIDGHLNAPVRTVLATPGN